MGRYDGWESDEAAEYFNRQAAESRLQSEGCVYTGYGEWRHPDRLGFTGVVNDDGSVDWLDQ